MTNPTHYKLPAPMVQAIVNTLGALPWGQVHQLMNPLMTELQAQEQAAAQAPAKPARKPKPPAA